MFDKEFYPTPRSVIETMLIGVDIQGKVILEPSAGKGDIVDVLKEYGAKEVIVCEHNKDLAKIVSAKADRFLNYDFFKTSSIDISHIDTIIMNPPFSNADEHILHAYEIAPDGCCIIALCNYETIHNSYSYRRNKLSKLIKENGTAESLNNAFTEAERSTDVSIGLVKLYKPRSGENEFEGYFDLEDDCQHHENGLMKHNAIEEVVNRYVGAVRMFDQVISYSDRMNDLIAPISNGNDKITFGATSGRDSFATITRDVFKKNLQKQAWKSVFAKFKIQKYVTDSVMEDINKFVEQQIHVPFTVRNIYKMVEMIIGTTGSRMDKVVEEVFDDLTMHYSENRFQVEGWKTNSEYRVNKKFIINWALIQMGFHGNLEASWTGRKNPLNDLTKALCFITGEKFDDMIEWRDFINGDKTKGIPAKTWGTWYDFNFFSVKCFKKGTVHVKFKSDEVWDNFNKTACKLKGFILASNFRSDFRKKSTGVKVY